MPEIFKMATLNINSMATTTRVAMLEDFLQKRKIDIILLQEVKRPVFDDIRGFTAYTNIGTAGRGTAILAREDTSIASSKIWTSQDTQITAGPCKTSLEGLT
jgi:exonuclease III